MPNSNRRSTSGSSFSASQPYYETFETTASKNVMDDLVDIQVFGQLLDMDEDEEDHSFSHAIVWSWFEQQAESIRFMEKALKESDLKTLAEKGHFLKGSSAALGLVKVRQSCESMQSYGQKLELDGKTRIESDADALERCKVLIEALKQQCSEAQDWLIRYYEDHNSELQ